MTTAAECSDIFAECTKRLQKGAEVYGDTDYLTKSLGKDIEEELEDVINYAAMLILKIRKLRARIGYRT